MGRVQEKIAAALAGEVASRTQWDEPPAVFWLALKGGEPYLVPAPVPPGLWAIGPPAQTLSVLAGLCSRNAGLMQHAAPDALHGAAFYSETWNVEVVLEDTSGIAGALADAKAGRIYTRSDRVETRSMWAVDRAGTVYTAVLRRGIDEAPLTQVEYPGPARTIAGDIPAALERIVSACLAVTMPPRT